MPVALRPGERWWLAFVSDTFGASRKFRMLAVNDDCCRKNMCLLTDTRDLRCEGARALAAHVRVCGKHSCGVRDNVLHAALLADLASGYYRIEVSRHVQSMA